MQLREGDQTPRSSANLSDTSSESSCLACSVRDLHPGLTPSVPGSQEAMGIRCSSKHWAGFPEDIFYSFSRQRQTGSCVTAAGGLSPPESHFSCSSRQELQSFAKPGLRRKSSPGPWGLQITAARGQRGRR